MICFRVMFHVHVQNSKVSYGSWCSLYLSLRDCCFLVGIPPTGHLGVALFCDRKVPVVF